MNLKLYTFLNFALIFSILLEGNDTAESYTEKTVREGDTVSFDCSYVSTKYVLIWYVQKYGGSIVFLLHDQSKKEDLDKGFKQRISATHYPENKTFPLTIRSIQRSDTGMYYCALENRTHIGGRSLAFQQGTRLIVEPGDNRITSPSVLVLKSQKETPIVACLAKDFYPKYLEIYMNSTKSSCSADKVPTKLSPQGKYSAALVANLGTNDVQCQAKHQEKWVTNTETTSKLKGLKNENKERDGSDSEKCQQTSERSNTLSLTVLGIRVLFAKAIAFNVIITAKFLAL
ncbi:T cell receptor alpha chain MC.7.G5-like [Phyllobates terribilis]|uniref:T cell receptor alpha chain MC.7.G5-like n=1 Tax=Phyllobates terribilis TaxID=111132 RepID=UPI003CCABC93